MFQKLKKAMAEHEDLVNHHKQKLEYYGTGNGQYHPNAGGKLQVRISYNNIVITTMYFNINYLDENILTKNILKRLVQTFN